MSPKIISRVPRPLLSERPSEWEKITIPSARSRNTGLNSDQLVARALFQACMCSSPLGVAVFV